MVTLSTNSLFPMPFSVMRKRSVRSLSITSPDGSVTDLSSRGRWFRDDALKLPPTVLNGASDLTLTFWIKTNKTGNQTIISSSSLNEFEFRMTSTFFIITINGSSVSFFKPSTIPAVTDNVYHHVAVTRDAALQEFNLFVDGVLWTNAFTSATPSTFNIAADGALYIGHVP